MKKFIVFLLGVLVFASPSWASIRNTKHDLSNSSTATFTNAGEQGTYIELCVYCHTPHKADTSVSNAPLWNRDLSAVGISSYYNSATLNALSKGAGVQTNIGNSDAILCLSCHDGASLTTALQNPPNSGGTGPSAEITGAADIGEGAAGSSDLSNDHPIGMVYADVQSATGEEFFADPTNGGANNIQFYDTGKMWCSSCHDVHDNTFAPFLVMDNTGSALCLACHDK